MDKDLNWSFRAQLSYNTPDTTIARIMHMNDYTAFETMELVGCPIIFLLVNFLVFPLVYCFIVIFAALR